MQMIKLFFGAFFLTGLLLYSANSFCFGCLQPQDNYRGWEYGKKPAPQVERILNEANDPRNQTTQASHYIKYREGEATGQVPSPTPRAEEFVHRSIGH
jgi:hypothetical protein